MSNVDLVAPSPRVLNHRVLFGYLCLVLALYLALAGYLLVEGKKLPLLFLLGSPALLYLLTQPRLALYAFVFSLLVKVDVISSLAISATDIAAMVLIGAAAFDFLLSSDGPTRLPSMTFNYVALLVALILSGIFSYNSMLAWRPIARVLILFFTFLAIHRVTARMELKAVLKFFFWIVAAHATIAIADFLAHGGHVRSFGLVEDTLDDFTMLALPIGLALFLWERKGALWNFVGTLLVLGGLIATQSRAPLLFDIPAVVLVVWWSRTRARSLSAAHVLTRIRRFVLITIVLAVILPVAKPGLFTTFSGRFERLLTTTPGETFRLRLVIWERALTVFADHPVLGLGPGTFRYYSEIYPTAHLQTVGYYVRSLSAHNLTLHYLAETGLTGALILLALFGNAFRHAWRAWKKTPAEDQIAVSVALLALAVLLVYSTLLEAGWMWGETSYVALLIIALIVQHAQRIGGQQENA